MRPSKNVQRKIMTLLAEFKFADIKEKSVAAAKFYIWVPADFDSIFSYFVVVLLLRILHVCNCFTLNSDIIKQGQRIRKELQIIVPLLYNYKIITILYIFSRINE